MNSGAGVPQTPLITEVVTSELVDGETAERRRVGLRAVSRYEVLIVLALGVAWAGWFIWGLLS
ncbi:MAG: hypothetical protein AB7J35_21980 [Dehalococcoidia bacterium]